MTASKQDERVGQIFHDAHLRLHRIDQDLKDLDCTELADPLPATSEFVEFTEGLPESPALMIGALYVKEGATNGNKFIAKKLRETMGLDEGKAMGYLDPHGKDQRRCWNAFKEQLNELDLTEQEEEECLEVAQETFKMRMNRPCCDLAAYEPLSLSLIGPPLNPLRRHQDGFGRLDGTMPMMNCQLRSSGMVTRTIMMNIFEVAADFQFPEEPQPTKAHGRWAR